MKEIVKVLLQEGIDEETIHEVLQVIEENYEFVNELDSRTLRSAAIKRMDQKDIELGKIDRKMGQAEKAGDDAKWDQLKQQRDEVENKYNQLQDRYDAAIKRSEPREKEERKQRIRQAVERTAQSLKNQLIK